MKGIGIVLLVAGLIGAVFALGMDTSVSTAYGSVNNIGLIAEKQNRLVLAGITAVVGAILFGFASTQQENKSKVTAKMLLQSPNKIIAAIKMNDIEALSSAIIAGDDFQTKSPKNGLTPLEYAEALEHYEIAALLRAHAATLKSAE